MIGNIISHYRITEKIGSGGMGVVYKAQDTKLDRFVALKFLPYEFTQDEEAVQRFINEAKNASSLQHENICTVHEIGDSDDETGGRHFICMDYYIGETLKQKLDKGVTGSNEWADVLIQTAEGLKAAHEKGVIHRDIKPSNIFVTSDGKVKILDFGLAKGVETTQLTRQGTTAGTVSYMSPEQLTGSKVDSRTDIWSFGVLMFELLCGTRPFKGDIEHAIIYSIINEEADCEPLDECNIPDALKDVICKCLEKNPSNRYRSVNDLLSELNIIYDQTTHKSTKEKSRSDRLTFRKLFKSNKFRLVFTIGILTIAYLACLIFCPRGIDDDMRVAVLPIKYTGEKQEERSICDGLSSYLSGQLTGISNSAMFRNSERSLHVVWTSELINSGVNTTERAMNEFNINYTISITLHFYDNAIEAHIGLISAEENYTIGSRSVIDTTKSRTDLQSEVAFKIAELLNIEREGIELAASGGVTNNAGAFDNYTRALGALADYELIENIDRAIFFFHEAIRKDTNYTAAYAGLAEAFYRKYYEVRNIQYADSASVYAYKALRKNPDHYEAQVSLGIVHKIKGQYEDAVNDFNRAIEISRYDDKAYRELARLYNDNGKYDLAIETLTKAINLKRYEWSNYNYLGYTYYRSDQLEKAKDQYKSVLKLRPYNIRAWTNLAGIYYNLGEKDSSYYAMAKSLEIKPTVKGYKQLGAIYFNSQRYTEAIEMFLKALDISQDDYTLWGNLGEAYYWSGQKDKAEEYYPNAIKLCEQMLEVNSKDTYLIVNLAAYYSRIGDKEITQNLINKAERYGVSDMDAMYTLSSTYEFIGERDKALEWLKKSLDAGFPIDVVESYPGFNELKKDERFRQLKENYK